MISLDNDLSKFCQQRIERLQIIFEPISVAKWITSARFLSLTIICTSKIV